MPESYINNRGVAVEQNHDVFALKLSAGDQAPIRAVPKSAKIKNEIEELIRGLDGTYSGLRSWSADEMSYHRYYDQQVGLSFHRDNLRFVGMIAVLTVLGESDFQIINREPVSYMVDSESGKSVVSEWKWHSTYTIPVSVGSLVLMRAPGLLPNPKNRELRPEHAVLNMKTDNRIAFLVRANNRPLDQNYGFSYYNWP